MNSYLMVRFNVAYLPFCELTEVESAAPEGAWCLVRITDSNAMPFVRVWIRKADVAAALWGQEEVM